MSEYSEKGSNFLPPVPDRSVSVQENVDARAVDSQATHCLLSLLQKGTASDDGPNTSVGPVEALFGTTFMKELQSAKAPVSAQRAPPGSARSDIFKPHDLSVSNVDGMGPTTKIFETKQPAKSDDPENWLHFDGQRVEVDPSVFSKQTIGAGEIHLPEEENLIIVGDATNSQNSNIEKVLPGDVAFDISEELAVLSSGFRGRGPYDMLEPERQFNNNQNLRPVFPPSDTNPQHMNSQMRFPDHLMQRDNTPISHKFPGNLHAPAIHHHDARVTEFDINANHQRQMLPQMWMQGIFQPPQLLRDLQRPQASNIMPDHGFLFAHQQTNIGGPRLPLSVGDGSNHAEAFQRMMEMELRAQSTQVRPVSVGHSQGMYGHGLDMGFRYR